MDDHDQRLKVLLKEFFADFFAAFFPEWAARLDCARVEWLDKEVFADPPQGSRRVLDLVARVGTRQAVAGPRPDEGDSLIALVHVEVESGDAAAPLRPRMYQYYELLRRAHGLPVLPIGLFLRVGLDGIGQDVYEEHFWDLPVLRFQYLYVGLPALEAERYVLGDNILAVALSSLMRVPEERRAWLRAEALRRIMECPQDHVRKFLLGECVQAYLGLSAEQQREFDRLVDTEPYQGVRQVATTWYEQGLERGEQQGQRRLLLLMIEKRFGPLSETARGRLEAASAEQLTRMAVDLLDAHSLKDLGLED